METERPAAPPERAAPTVEGERIESLDVVRGFALGGVLLMNMQAFAGVFAVYMNPTAAGGLSGIDRWLWNVNHVLADQRFITIFSMLFGAGVLLFTRRLEERTGRSAGVHYRRMLWLAVFGAAHAYLLWFGDILLPYALAGLLLWPCRRLRPGLQALLGATLVVATLTLHLGMESYLEGAPPDEVAELAESWSPSPARVAEIETAYRGGFLEQQVERVREARSFHALLPFFLWRLLGFMLIGMALLKSGFLLARRPYGTYLALGVVGVLGGAALSAAGIARREAHDWELGDSMGIGGLYHDVGAAFGAFGWLSLVLAACAAGALPAARRRLAAVGRMAFTNYLMQTAICTSIFYGHGLGLYGSVGRVGQLALTIGIFALQLVWSPLWLERFSMGPLEWLWRTLTYGRAPKARRPLAVAGAENR